MENDIYIVFVHHIIGAILSIITFFYSIKILFVKTFQQKAWYLSTALTIYYFYVLLTSLLSLIFYSYIFIWWRFNSNIYQPQILYILVCLQWLFLNVSPITEFFLAVDRCLILINVTGYSSRGKTLFITVNFFTVFFCALALIYLNDIFTSMPRGSLTNCRFAGCLLIESQYKVITKVIFSFINFAAGIVLAILIKLNFKGRTLQTRRLNKTLFYILMTTTIIEIIPFLGSQLFHIITGTQVIEYIGPYANTLFLTNITILALIYYRTLTRSFSNQATFIGTTNNQVICAK